MLALWYPSIKFSLRFLRRDLIVCQPQHASNKAARKQEEMGKQGHFATIAMYLYKINNNKGGGAVGKKERKVYVLLEGCRQMHRFLYTPKNG